MTDSKMYIQILIDSLKKKSSLLDNLISMTKDQAGLIDQNKFEPDSFEQLMESKKEILSELVTLDQGFNAIYQQIKTDVVENKEALKEEIIVIQAFIAEITRKSVELQSLEIRNKANLEISMNRNRTKVKQFHKSTQMASSYYKNMGNYQTTDGVFMDRKK